MSWSRSFTGTPNEAFDAAKAAQEEIESTLPEFERGDVNHAVTAAGILLSAINPTATVSLSLSGHGYLDTEGKGGGSLGVGISYVLPIQN